MQDTDPRRTWRGSQVNHLSPLGTLLGAVARPTSRADDDSSSTTDCRDIPDATEEKARTSVSILEVADETPTTRIPEMTSSGPSPSHDAKRRGGSVPRHDQPDRDTPENHPARPVILSKTTTSHVTHGDGSRRPCRSEPSRSAHGNNQPGRLSNITTLMNKQPVAQLGVPEAQDGTPSAS